MPAVEITKPEKPSALSKAYQDLAKAKRNKDLTAIAAAEDAIRTLKA